jgi:hypothetical protein
MTSHELILSKVFQFATRIWNYGVNCYYFLGIPPFLPRKLVGSLTSYLDHHQMHNHFVLQHDLILASRTLDLIFDWFSTDVDRRHLPTFSRIDSHTLSTVKLLLELCELVIVSSYFLASISTFFFGDFHLAFKRLYFSR